MPYRHAPYFVGFVLLVIMAGFWASYFAFGGAIPLAFHVHAISSMMWLAGPSNSTAGSGGRALCCSRS